MRKCLFIISLICAVTLSAQTLHRVPARPTPMDIVQPNGDTLTVRLIGDEHYHYNTTEDGYLIKQNSRGYYYYAQYSKKGDIKATRKKAHNADKRTRCENKYIEKNIPKKAIRR